MRFQADLLAALDAAVPLDAAVRVILRRPSEELLARCWFDSALQCYYLQFDPAAGELAALAVIHEWAHCATACDCTEEHCDHWGVQYARCLRASEKRSAFGD